MEKQILNSFFLYECVEILKKASDNVVNILRNTTPILDTGETEIRNTAFNCFVFLQYYSWFSVDFFNTNDHPKNKIKPT